MHFEHQLGTLLQVDFAGAPLHYADQSTGELIACPVFIAVLPFGGYGYVEALPNAKLPQVVKALNNTLDYFGGCPLGVKSDNMRRGYPGAAGTSLSSPRCSSSGPIITVLPCSKKRQSSWD